MLAMLGFVKKPSMGLCRPCLALSDVRAVFVALAGAGSSLALLLGHV
jgi:hypothetical protein